MRFESPLQRATFLARSKRFLVDAELGGSRVLVHTNNTGSMMGLLRPGGEVWLSCSSNPKRRCPFTLEAVETDAGPCLVNTLGPNRLLAESALAGLLPGCPEVTAVKSEPAFEHGRLDACLETPSGPVLVEAKNVTLVESGVALFPDAVTERGRKHLYELARLARQGVRAAMFYLAPHPEARCFAPADMIDPAYAAALGEAVAAGVEVWAFAAVVDPEGVRLSGRLDVAWL